MPSCVCVYTIDSVTKLRSAYVENDTPDIVRIFHSMKLPEEKPLKVVKQCTDNVVFAIFLTEPSGLRKYTTSS